MPRWTHQNYNEYLSRRANGAVSSAEPQRPIRNEPMAETPRKETHTGRFRVGVISYRWRLIDPDNLCPKYFIDCLRYAEIIPDDRPEDIELSVKQIKCAKGEDRTIITVEQITNDPRANLR